MKAVHEMRVVVDTNVIAYYLLKTEPFFDETQRFWHEIREPIAPSSWSAEFANAVWVITRAEVLDVADALERLRLAALLGIRGVDATTLCAGALSRALAANHPVYDTLFVELAARESVPLATFDRKILSLFPAFAVRPNELVP